ncbi:hypothetical protein L2E82_19482 [Cichorium intybus]|uniref:Uncharacterized protein n=1 Tax=Cichorium intybus TaxID=13427 RepID=A0ACB9FC68_CICIN|nr:hypothetical protein L2E82_19482 [Cichorium intybus]
MEAVISLHHYSYTVIALLHNHLLPSRNPNRHHHEHHHIICACPFINFLPFFTWKTIQTLAIIDDIMFLVLNISMNWKPLPMLSKVLSVDPVIGAIAGGNVVVLKPSEIAPAMSSLLKKLLEEYVDDSVVKVVEGGVPETSALLEQKWDKFSIPFNHLWLSNEAAISHIPEV